MGRSFLLLSVGSVALALAVALQGCTSGTPKRPRLVVLYAACSLNKDFLSPYDASRRFTPNFARFAEDSVVFEKHMSEAGQSGIAFASLFSGSQADVHGVYRHPTPLQPHLYQITEAFRDAGYDTYFWSGQRMASIEYGYGQGVSRENAYVVSPRDKLSYTANEPRFRKILDRLREDPDYEAFVQINLTLSHSPYHQYAPRGAIQRFVAQHPSEHPGLSQDDMKRLLEVYARFQFPLQWNYPETIEKLRAYEDELYRLREGDVPKLHALLEFLYKVAVYRLDTYVGQWLDSIEEAGLLDDSLIVFTADHGEVLYRENALYKWTHGLQLAPEVLNVPFLLMAPSLGVSPGRYGHVTRSIDVYPTMAGLCGIELPTDADIEGVDLSAAVLGEETPPDLVAFSHTSTLGPNLLELSFGTEDFTGDGRIDAGPLTPWTLVMERIPTEDVQWCWVGARHGDTMAKRIWDGSEFQYELYDLATDPGETRSLFDPGIGQHRALAAQLDAYYERLLHGPYAKTELSAKDLENLEALGYVEGVTELEGPAEEAAPGSGEHP
jgi:arylsulfatase A-like enzyme